MVIRAHCDDAGREFDVRSYPTKTNVHRALTLAKELSSVLGTLTQDENYRCYNTGGERLSVAALEQTRDSVAQSCEQLELDHKFNRKSARDRDRIRKVQLVRRLLEISKKYLNTGFPVEVKDTQTSGPFVKYVELCTGLTGQRLINVLRDVVAQFARQRKTTRRRGVPQRVSRKI